MFSTSTIALSTNIPSARMSENSTIMFSVMPSAATTIIASSSDSGIDSATNRLLRTPMNTMSTPITSSNAVRIPFSRSLTIVEIISD